jgi:hemoglobin-like flavoprotein
MMPLDLAAIELLNSTILTIEPRSQEFGIAVYQKFLTIHPAAARFFSDSDVVIFQSEILGLIKSTISCLSSTDALDLLSLQAQGFSYLCKYGIISSYYLDFELILLETLADYLAVEWTPDVVSAWAGASAFIFGQLSLGAEHSLPHDVPEAAGDVSLSTFFEKMDVEKKVLPEPGIDRTYPYQSMTIPLAIVSCILAILAICFSLPRSDAPVFAPDSQVEINN